MGGVPSYDSLGHSGYLQGPPSRDSQLFSEGSRGFGRGAGTEAFGGSEQNVCTALGSFCQVRAEPWPLLSWSCGPAAVHTRAHASSCVRLTATLLPAALGASASPPRLWCLR